MDLVTRKPVFGVSDQVISTQACSTTEISKESEFSLECFSAMIISNKALIRLCKCAGWSVPLSFANPEDSFFRIKAHMCFPTRSIYSLKMIYFFVFSWLPIEKMHICLLDWRAAGSSLTGITMLCPWAWPIYPCLVLVQPRKTHPDITEKIVDWDVKNQIKQSIYVRILSKMHICLPIGCSLILFAI